MDIKIVSPADSKPRDWCSSCNKDFDASEERIQTLMIPGSFPVIRRPRTTMLRRGSVDEVTLCRGCYEEAGSSVR